MARLVVRTRLAVIAGLTGRSIAGRPAMLGYRVYMLASGYDGTLCVGVTGDPVRRVAEHRASALPGFTDRDGVKQLVWHETHDPIETAIRREQRLKKWPRAWKVALIEAANPKGRDLWAEISGCNGWPGRAQAVRSRGGDDRVSAAPQRDATELRPSVTLTRLNLLRPVPLLPGPAFGVVHNTTLAQRCRQREASISLCDPGNRFAAWRGGARMPRITWTIEQQRHNRQWSTKR